MSSLRLMRVRPSAQLVVSLAENYRITFMPPSYSGLFRGPWRISLTMCARRRPPIPALYEVQYKLDFFFTMPRTWREPHLLLPLQRTDTGADCDPTRMMPRHVDTFPHHFLRGRENWLEKKNYSNVERFDRRGKIAWDSQLKKSHLKTRMDGIPQFIVVQLSHVETIQNG